MELTIGKRTIKLNGSRGEEKKPTSNKAPLKPITPSNTTDQTGCFCQEEDVIVINPETVTEKPFSGYTEQDLPEEYVHRSKQAIEVQPTRILESVPPHLSNKDAMTFHFENFTKYSMYFQNAQGDVRVCPASEKDRRGTAYVYYKDSKTNRTQVYEFAETDLLNSDKTPIFLPLIDMAITINPVRNNFHPRLMTFENICDMTMRMLKSKHNYAGIFFAISTISSKPDTMYYVVYKNYLYPVRNVKSPTNSDIIVISESDGYDTSLRSHTLGMENGFAVIHHKNDYLHVFSSKEQAEAKLASLLEGKGNLYDQLEVANLKASLTRKETDLEELRLATQSEIIKEQEAHSKALNELQRLITEKDKKLSSYSATEAIQQELNNQLLQSVKATRDVHKQATDVVVSNNRSSAAASGVEKEELSVWKAGLGVLAAGVGLAFILGKKSVI